jgi:hypothetical protein
MMMEELNVSGVVESSMKLLVKDIFLFVNKNIKKIKLKVKVSLI